MTFWLRARSKSAGPAPATRRRLARGAAVGVLAAGIIATAMYRPDRVLFIGAGLAAYGICSTTFVSGLPPERALDRMLPNLLGFATRLIRYDIDRHGRTVSASFFGLARRNARFTPGYGCRLEYSGNAPMAAMPTHAVPPTADDFAPAERVRPIDRRIARAIDRVFAEHAGANRKSVSAVVVVRNGEVIAERYADGVGINTPLLGWSIAKSFTNAFAGVLTRQGRMQVTQAIQAPEWRGAGDARAAITFEDLLRMRSGLDAIETGSPRDPVAHMEFAERDMAAFAGGRPLKRAIGTEWDYSSANTLLAGRFLGALIGNGAAGMRAFAEREIFRPLGMTSVTMEFDGAGTFVGSSFIHASARDYARLGQLYLDDGIGPDGSRILPKGWVSWSTNPTLGSPYGAGFWTNRGDSPQAHDRITAGFPKDGFYASGVFGQRIYIVPSSRIVIVRLGDSAAPDFGFEDDLALIASVAKSRKMLRQ